MGSVSADEVKVISRRKAVNKILKSNGTKFTVAFIKRSDNSIRKMTCVKGGSLYESHLKGGELAFDPKTAKLMVVLDTSKKDFRSIPIDGLTLLTIEGVTYRIKD